VRRAAAARAHPEVEEAVVRAWRVEIVEARNVGKATWPCREGVSLTRLSAACVLSHRG